MSPMLSTRVLRILAWLLVASLICAAFAPIGALAQPDQPGSPVLTAVDVAGPYFTVESYALADGTSLERMIISGPPQPPAGFEAEAARAAELAGDVLLPVPAYNWVFGCSAVSASMIAAYWDRNGLPNMYTGPTNGGVMPMDNNAATTGWATWSDGSSTYPSNPLTASRLGVDGRTTRGSIDDYWVSYGGSASDPYITGGWAQHAWGTAVGDYMWTSQSSFGNTDGATSFWGYGSNAKLTCATMESGNYDDGTIGRKHFYEERGYTIASGECYNQATDNRVSGGFSFAQYKAKIDAGYPVFLNLAGHSIVGVGYNAGTTPPTVILNDTWNWGSGTHSMPWGGSYSNMALQSVSIADPVISTPSLPTVSINDVAVAEGNSGTTTASFTVRLSTAPSSAVTVNWATLNGSATAGSDYVAGSATVSFAIGEQAKTVAVTVNGDTTYEGNETFYVNLSGATNATIADSQGVGTITNDDPAPACYTLTKAVSPTGSGSVSASPAPNCNGGTQYTENQVVQLTATANSGYTFANWSGAATGSTNPTSVTMSADTSVTANFQQVAPPSIGIDDVLKNEGNKGTTNFVFTIRLSSAASSQVTVNWATVNGTAVSSGKAADYVAASGTASFPVGSTSTTVTVQVKGDRTRESNDTFFVNLSGATGPTISDGQGQGTIVNDD